MSEESDILDKIIGQEVVAYHQGDESTTLKFEDGTMLQWSGYYHRPVDADTNGFREMWEERYEGEWVDEG